MTKGLENGWQLGEASRDFDVRRAFAHGEYMGALREQERIIKLLEIHYPGRLAGVKALIKGEKQ